MTNTLYGTAVSNSGRGDFPELRVVNMVPETEPTADTLVLNSRKGLENSPYTFGQGPVRALYTVDGVLGGDLFGVSGNSFYSVGDGLVGSVDGDGPAYIKGFETDVFYTGGESLWRYDGTALSAVAVPDDSNVVALAIGTSRLLLVKGDSGLFYWSDPLSDNIDALSFATAENSPDKLKDVLFIGDTAILFGSETVEFWPANSSDPDVPFQVLPGRTFQKGIKSTGCATGVGNSFAWVTSQNEICYQSPDSVISTPAIEDKIRKSNSVRLWSFELFQTEYLALTLDDKTYCMSLRYGQWVEFSSYNESNWLPQCFGGQWFGSSKDGRILQWSEEYSDFGAEITRIVNVWVSLDTEVFQVFNILPRVNTGSSRSVVISPSIEMRFSKDGGKTWSAWKARSLGEEGYYGKKVNWGSLGVFKYPGGLLEFRVTDPTDFRFSGVTINNGY